MIELIFSAIALVLAFIGMMISRHYYHKTKRIEQSLKSREERPRYGQK